MRSFRRMMVVLLAVLMLGSTACTKQISQEAKEETVPTEPGFSLLEYDTYYIVNCEEGTSLYAAADIGSQQLSWIPLGAGVSYIQNAENGFCKVAYQGVTGYVFAENLSDTAPDNTQQYVTYYVVNCHENITLRVAPDSGATAVCKIPLGSSVSYISTASNGFYKVIYNGQTGYALSSYLSQDPQSHSAPQESSGYVSNGVYATCYVVNCAQSITLRANPDTGSYGYCQIPLGAAVSYVGTASNGFYKIVYNGQVGYALACYLSFTRPSGYTYNQVTYLQVVNCQTSITLRTAPSTSAGEYCQIPLGSYVEYLGTYSNGFYLVAYNGYVGYALASYLR